MRMQGQANCLLDEPPDPGEQQRLPSVPDKLQWHLPSVGNRTPLKRVTVSQSLYPLTPQSCGPAPLLLRVGVACKTTNTLGLQTIEQLRVDFSPYRDEIPFP